MANENILNVKLRGDLSELTSTLNAKIAVVKNFGKNASAAVSDVQKSFQGFQGVGGNIVKNFQEIATGANVLSKVNTSISAAADHTAGNDSGRRRFARKTADGSKQSQSVRYSAGLDNLRRPDCSRGSIRDCVNLGPSTQL